MASHASPRARPSRDVTSDVPAASSALPPWLPARPGAVAAMSSPLAWRRPRLAGPPLSAASASLRDASNRFVGAQGQAGGFELAVDGPPVRRFATVQVLREDKFVFDALQGWYRAQTGRPVYQWDLFTQLLVEALDHEGVFARAAS